MAAARCSTRQVPTPSVSANPSPQLLLVQRDYSRRPVPPPSSTRCATATWMHQHMTAVATADSGSRRRAWSQAWRSSMLLATTGGSTRPRSRRRLNGKRCQDEAISDLLLSSPARVEPFRGATSRLCTPALLRLASFCDGPDQHGQVARCGSRPWRKMGRSIEPEEPARFRRKLNRLDPALSNDAAAPSRACVATSRSRL